LLILLPIVAAAYLLWPTYTYYRLNADREAVAADSAALEQWDAANGEDFLKARNARLKLGLDLRGGMYVTLEVDVLKLIEESADPSSVDDDLLAIIDKTRKETDNTDLDVLDTFLKNFRGAGKSLLQYFTVTNQSDPTEASIEEKLRRDADGAVEQALEVIKQRINKYELSEVNIQKQGARRIVIELPDVKDEKEIRSLLQTTARLEFKRVLMNRDLIKAFYAIDNVLKGVKIEEPATDSAALAADSTKKDTASVAKADSAKTDSAAAKRDTTNPYAGLSDDEAARRIKKDYPFSYMLTGMFAQSEKSSYQQFDLILKKAEDFPEQGLYRFVISGKLLPQLLKYLDRPDVKRAIPSDLDIIVAAKPEGTPAKDGTPEFYDVYGVAREADLTGDVVTEAFPSFDQASNQPIVLMEMNSDGAERWAQITGANVNKRIAIVLDGRVYSAPVVQTQSPNGSSQITGSGTPEEANLLAVVLKAGALKAPVKIIEERVVGPSLGEDSIRRGITSSLMSFALIVLFMLVYYSMGGALADIALMMNVLLVVAGLAGFGGTLTLPGIAGLILSTAMAVDANILIFERMREELYAGKTLKAAVDQGFAKAWSAIIDSNLTNILATIPLLVWGSGPVKGFAVTLLVGAIITLFTAVVVTRAMFNIIVASGATTINIGQKRTA
jgi:preprotein translocase subunit SecD